jgi:hypothetical protein
MARLLVALIAAGLVAVPGRAGETSPTPETVVRLDVRAAPAPSPALRYQLLPELREMNPGNPIFHYFKCCMEQESFFFDRESFERREKLLAMPLKQLPAQDLQEYGRSALMQADRAARLDKPDWQILLTLRADGIATLLPDVQQIRAPARALQVRFRSEVALGRFDDAIRTCKTMFAMSRHLGEHPTLIGDLVGLAIANSAIVTLEEMVNQPDCPNLYWALTNLPVPLVPLNKGMDGERMIVTMLFRDLDDSRPMSPEQLKTFIAEMDKLLGEEEPIKSARGVRGWLDARNKDSAKIDAARRRLIESGLPEERVRRFPADQVIFLDEKCGFEIRRDDFMKTLNLPVWQGEAVAARIKPDPQPNLFAGALLGGLDSVHRAQGRLDQRIAMLRHAEALRLHAAEHDGKLPAKLSEISVPLPDDPFTGKPFRYERIGDTAHLRGTPPASDAKNPAFNVHYVLTVRK